MPGVKVVAATIWYIGYHMASRKSGRYITRRHELHPCTAPACCQDGLEEFSGFRPERHTIARERSQLLLPGV
jgi:hypothetical protein